MCGFSNITLSYFIPSHFSLFSHSNHLKILVGTVKLWMSSILPPNLHEHLTSSFFKLLCLCQYTYNFIRNVILIFTRSIFFYNHDFYLFISSVCACVFVCLCMCAMSIFLPWHVCHWPSEGQGTTSDSNSFYHELQ